MSRIPIFDSAATEGSAGQPVDNPLAQDQWSYSRPVPLRSGPAGDQRNIAYEFVLSGEDYSAWDFEWYQSFWGDCPFVNLGGAPLPPSMRQTVAIGAFPLQRVFPDSLDGYPWAREQIAIAGLIGAINHYNITRYVTMTVPGPGEADCRWFPMLVHAYWVRIHVRTTTALPQGATTPRLRVFAHVGGASEIGEYTERQDKPFDWEIPEA